MKLVRRVVIQTVSPEKAEKLAKKLFDDKKERIVASKPNGLKRVSLKYRSNIERLLQAYSSASSV